MTDAYQNRSFLARTVTRRTNELRTAIRCDISKEELLEKITNLRYSMEQLGTTQDMYLAEVGDDDEMERNRAEDWYLKYDESVNHVIRDAKAEITRKTIVDRASPPQDGVKIKRLEVPKFKSTHKTYLKWKSTFERYTAHMDTELRYDYLFSHTEGKAHEYVANKSTYEDAIEKLDEKFGNVHTIMAMLLDDIKVLPVTKRGDFVGFEKLSFAVSNFRDRLREMGLRREAENKYILIEIENKLNELSEMA